MNEAIIAKYEKALKKAHNSERLQCYVLAIFYKLKELRAGATPTVLDVEWVDYFLNSSQGV